MKKVFIIASVILGIVLAGVYFFFFRKPEPKFELVQVKRATISQEVMETGTVKKDELYNLGFDVSGKIAKIYVQVGDKVKAGSILAELDNSDLLYQLKEAKASLKVAQSNLEKLLAGATKEEIQIAQIAVENAQIDLEIAQQGLEDVQERAEKNLESAYEDSLNVLDDVYLKIYNAFNTAKLIQEDYFNSADQDSTKVKDNLQRIKDALDNFEVYWNKAKTSKDPLDIESALSKGESELNIVFDALTNIRQSCEAPLYKNKVSSTDKTSLDTQRSYISSALSSFVNSEQTIETTKVQNSLNINTAQGKVDTAEGQLKSSQKKLEKLLSPPRQEDIDLYTAQVKQAEARVKILEAQLEKTRLRAPVDGEITDIAKKTGEIFQAMGNYSFIKLLPDAPFHIEVDIYEEDIVKIKIGNPVDISLIAYPDKVFKGRVIFIDPAEKIKDEVVYYRVKIAFDEIPQGIKPGMSADLKIKTASKQNVLVVPEQALEKKNGKAIVKVFEDGKVKEEEIEIGLLSSDGQQEVVSGLKEGEKIVLP